MKGNKCYVMITLVLIAVVKKIDIVKFKSYFASLVIKH